MSAHVIYSFTKAVMTTLEWQKVHLCTFCYNAHQNRSNELQFDNARKRVVKNCSFCIQPMCLACVEHSEKKIEGSILTAFNLVICKDCISWIWRQQALKPKLEKIATDELEEAKKRMSMKIYSITHEQACVQSLKH